MGSLIRQGVGVLSACDRGVDGAADQRLELFLLTAEVRDAGCRSDSKHDLV
jgi:hypothetical protein